MSDKRRCHRLHIELPATFKASEKDDQISIGTTVDISALGVCLVTREALKIGQELAVQLILPGGDKTRIRVKVVWVKEKEYYDSGKEYLTGIKILEPMQADEARFIKYFVKEFLTA